MGHYINNEDFKKKKEEKVLEIKAKASMLIELLSDDAYDTSIFMYQHIAGTLDLLIDTTTITRKLINNSELEIDKDELDMLLEKHTSKELIEMILKKDECKKQESFDWDDFNKRIEHIFGIRKRLGVKVVLDSGYIKRSELIHISNILATEAVKNIAEKVGGPGKFRIISNALRILGLYGRPLNIEDILPKHRNTVEKLLDNTIDE